MGIFYAQKGDGGNGNGTPEVKWDRVGIASATLGVLLAVGIWCSMNNIEPWNSILPGTFEIGIGGVFGVLLGEKVAHS